MGIDAVDLPYLSVDNHARMALCFGWYRRYLDRTNFCHCYSWNEASSNAS